MLPWKLAEPLVGRLRRVCQRLGRSLRWRLPTARTDPSLQRSRHDDTPLPPPPPPHWREDTTSHEREAQTLADWLEELPMDDERAVVVSASPSAKRKWQDKEEEAASASTCFVQHDDAEFDDESQNKATKGRQGSSAEEMRVTGDFADDDEELIGPKRSKAKAKGTRKLVPVPSDCLCQICRLPIVNKQDGANYGSSGHVCFRHKECHCADRRLADSIRAPQCWWSWLHVHITTHRVV